MSAKKKGGKTASVAPVAAEADQVTVDVCAAILDEALRKLGHALEPTRPPQYGPASRELQTSQYEQNNK